MTSDNKTNTNNLDVNNTTHSSPTDHSSQTKAPSEPTQTSIKTEPSVSKTRHHQSESSDKTSNKQMLGKIAIALSIILAGGVGFIGYLQNAQLKR